MGEGAAAVIYKVSNVHTGLVFAAKVLRQSVAKSEFVKDRFLAETRILQGLDHPNIVRVHDSYRSDRLAACIMQYVEGSTLEQYLPLHPGGLSEVLTYSLAMQVVDAMRYAHAQKIVHRDLKPSNILLQQEADGNLRAYVADFGLAKALATGVKTQTGLRVGTMAYMAPEQIKDSSRVDERADLYALGISLYECLTGVLPFNFRSMVQIIDAQMNQPVPSVLHHRVDVSPRWDTIIAKACEKRREERFESATAMLKALRQLGDELGLTARSTIAISPVRVGEGDVDDLDERKTAQFVSVRSNTDALGWKAHPAGNGPVLEASPLSLAVTSRHTVEMKRAMMEDDLERRPTQPRGVPKTESPEELAEQLFHEDPSAASTADDLEQDLTLRGDELTVMQAELLQKASLSDLGDRTATDDLAALEGSVESGELEEHEEDRYAFDVEDDSVVVRASLLREATSKDASALAGRKEGGNLQGDLHGHGAKPSSGAVRTLPVTRTDEASGNRARALGLVTGGGPSRPQLVFLLALFVMGLAALCVGLYFALR